MNSLIPINNTVLTMSSREIAELTKKEHKNVLRVIRELVNGHILDAQNEPLKFEYRNQLFDYYELNKRDSLVVVARLSPEFMAFVVDRWQELEANANRVSLPSTKELALMVVQAEEEKEKLLLENKALESKVEEMQPEVNALHRIANIRDSVCITEAARMLHVRPMYLTSLMSENKWMYRRVGGKSWLGYHDKIHSGLIEHKLTTVYLEDGSEKVCTQVRVTPKGITKLADVLEKLNYQKQLLELRA